jgi:hypothetical protein
MQSVPVSPLPINQNELQIASSPETLEQPTYTLPPNLVH